MAYEEYGEIVDGLYSGVHSYCEEQDIRFHAIVPIMRSGAIIGSMMAVRFGIDTIIPIQFRGDAIVKNFHYVLPKHANILICENNTDTGETAVKTIQFLQQQFSDARLYYLSVARVYGGPKTFEGTEEYFCGIETNERFAATEQEAEELGLRPKITIFPWESVAQELEKINSERV